MPSGVYIRTKPVWNKGKKGLQIAWNKGIPGSEEMKRKVSEANRGRKYPNRKRPPPVSEETKKKLSEAKKGERNPMYGVRFKHTKEALEKISKAGMGRFFSEETRKKMSEALLGKPNFKNRGEKSHFWKGGITPRSRAIRGSLEYRLWRNSVLKKNDYTCQECGIRGGRLQADHIKPFSLILYENNVKTLEEGLNCKELWDINNGRTLCVPCHKKTDTYLNRKVVLKQVSLVK